MLSLSLTCFFLASMSVPCTATTFKAFFFSADIKFFLGGLVALRPPPHGRVICEGWLFGLQGASLSRIAL